MLVSACMVAQACESGICETSSLCLLVLTSIGHSRRLLQSLGGLEAGRNRTGKEDQ